MVSSTPSIVPNGLQRSDIVPSRKIIKLPAWLEVVKPRLIPLLLATTIGGMALSEGWPLPSLKLFCTLAGGAFAAAAAGALNCLWEQDLDGRMKRTSGRALPSGRLSPSGVFLGSVVCTLISSVLLVGGVNCLAAGLSLLGLCSYVLLYTVYLKPRTSQNIVFGGIAGAIPPLVGVAAASGHLTFSGWWLFALIMVWTPVHFWSLALFLKDDYKSVGIPMLPVVKGSLVTVQAIVQYCWITIFLSVLGIWALPEGRFLYGLLLMPFNVRLFQMVHYLAEAPSDLKRAKGLFRWSILYMFGICLLLVISRLSLSVQFDIQSLALIKQIFNS